VAALAMQWRREVARALETRMQGLDGLGRRLVHPAARLAQQSRDVQALSGRLARAFRHNLRAAATDVESVGRRLARQLRTPPPEAARLVAARDAWRRAAGARLERTAARVAALEQSLAHLNPQAVLERGYAIVARADGAIVYEAAQVAPGDDVDLRFARGAAAAKITRRE
jgi:exodeoxyribonuclease VII large subunit